MKRMHVLSRSIIVAALASASLAAAQTTAPKQPTEQQKLKERVDTLESQLKEAQAKADRATTEKDYIERIHKESVLSAIALSSDAKARPAPASASSFWSAFPGILWFGLAFVLLLLIGKQLKQILTEFTWRLRSGAGIKIASVELGSMVIARGAEVSQEEKLIGVRPDADKAREDERDVYRRQTHDIMLVHRLYRSREERQRYDLVIYVVPHKKASLVGVSRVEYFLGSYWGNKIFPSSDRSRGFAIATSAYGPMLCTAEVFFNDGTSAMLHRYIDFEMGAWAPGQATDLV